MKYVMSQTIPRSRTGWNSAKLFYEAAETQHKKETTDQYS